jgi:Fur family ferric uptake transcriptional regulator
MPRRQVIPDLELEERLRAAGIRPTRGRLRVLGELAREPDDATAQVLHRRLNRGGKRIGLATVYRALGDFVEAGVIDSLPHGATETGYRLCGEGHHHHLVCSSCRRVVELTDCRVGDWLPRAAAEEGFVVSEHRLEAVGLCAECRGQPATLRARCARPAR